MMWVGFFVPAVIFLTLVAPIWIVFHYLTQWKRMKAAPEPRSTAAPADIDRLRRRAQALEARIATLEKLLDSEAADRRDR